MNLIRRRRGLRLPYANLATHLTASRTQRWFVATNTTLTLGAAVDWTVAGWVYQDSLAVGRDLWGKSGAAGNRGVRCFADATPNFNIRNSVDGTALTTVTGLTPVLNTWLFVVTWMDTGALTMNIQVNNGAVASLAVTAGTFNTTAPFEIGGNVQNGTYWDGRLDSVGLWISATGAGGVLSAAQKTALYNNGVGLAFRDLVGTAALMTALVGWWDFDASGLDAGFAGNNLTPVNTPDFVTGKR